MGWIFVALGIGVLLSWLLSKWLAKPETTKFGISTNNGDYFTQHSRFRDAGGVATSSMLAGAAADSFMDDAFLSGSSMSDSFTDTNDSCQHTINPANGLPMVGCVDIEGNPYGTNSSHDQFSSCDSIFDHPTGCTSSLDDSISSSSSSMFDDSYSSISSSSFD